MRCAVVVELWARGATIDPSDLHGWTGRLPPPLLLLRPLLPPPPLLLLLRPLLPLSPLLLLVLPLLPSLLPPLLPELLLLRRRQL